MSATRSRWLAFLFGVLLAATMEAQQKPNIIFIMGDDIGWFGRFGVGGSQVSGGASTQIGTGFVMEGPLEYLGLVPRLTNDYTGIAFVWSQPSATSKTAYHRNEYVAETFYTLQLSPMMRLQPDLQIVWNPAFNPDPGPFTIVQTQFILAW